MSRWHDAAMTAEVVLSFADLDGAVAAFVELGFRVDLVVPADDPAVVGISGHGLRLRLVRGADLRARLRLGSAAPGERAIGAVCVELVEPAVEDPIPPLVPEVVIVRGGAWHTGRAGMLYRDLLPGRLGGRYVASHIRIPDGGPVPDYVHFHAVQFQLIYCHRGWVRLVYEDQGPPFVMQAGDCVVQPPHIRHRVLEASDGLEVIEVGCPAVHATRADHELVLPTPQVRNDRTWRGQHFACHRAPPGGGPRDLGVAAATGGVASARISCITEPSARTAFASLSLCVVLSGEPTLHCGERISLSSGDAFALPAGTAYELAGRAELLEVEAR
ncbi:MAG: cupin domain-containing protein [Deltaproteobacteria bacterium]|nr:cupin domain-containing protein [Deltaproteobacteria bacterium]